MLSRFVLIVPAEHTVSMTAFLAFLVIVAILGLAGRYGADSRTDRPGRQF
jgi:hypothetical protein